jgi:IS30 family transposase
MKYKHLSLAEREVLVISRSQGISLRKIAQKLGRNQSSLSRELQRNINYGNEYFGNKYLPCRAQLLAEKRGLKQRHKAPLKEPLIWLYVREHLRKPYFWTPEEISKRLPLEYRGKYICTESIYQYIYSREGKRYKFWQFLPNGRKKRMKKLGRKVQRSGKIPGSISIEKRPKYIQKRKQFGHWETDNVIGKNTDAYALSVTVERSTRFTILSKVQRSASSKTAGLVNRLLKYPQGVRKTITTDNGAENSYHSQVTTLTGMKVFFCHAYHSWEKGTVENTNGRIRRFVPKGLSIDQIPDQYIKELENRLNNTPRKCLNYLTPQEKVNILLGTS